MGKIDQETALEALSNIVNSFKKEQKIIDKELYNKELYNNVASIRRRFEKRIVAVEKELGFLSALVFELKEGYLYKKRKEQR